MTDLYAVRNLRRCFGEREVLNIPELNLEAGTIYGLLGPNGSGKTTLMRLLSFMDVPTEGEIFYRGEVVTPHMYQQYRARVVWVPQTPVMFSGTLLYNVEYPMRIKGVPKQERREKAMELLTTIGLARLAQAPARRLSGGEAQRGSIARALAAGAEVILFDEPTASVDFRSRGEIIKLIHDLWKERGLSIIVTTHDFDLAAEVCREEITLFDGKIVSRYPLTVSDTGGMPRAVTARLGGMHRENGRLVVSLERDEFSPDKGTRTAIDGKPLPTQVKMTLVGMVEGATGVALRLRLAPGNDIEILFTGREDMAMAKELTLDCELYLEK